MIYWIKAGPTGPVKIGYVMSDVLGRIRELQTGAHIKLVLLRTEPGGRNLETALHRRYHSKRCFGEWFDLTDDDVAAEIPHVEPRRQVAKQAHVVPIPPVAAAIKAVGNGARLARICGVTRCAVQQWKATGIPPKHVWRISKATGIEPEILRPDMWQPA